MEPMTRLEILQAALTLPPDERLTVARQLALSIDGENGELSEARWDAAWADEAERRHQDIEDGKVQLVAGEEVMARVRAILRS